MTRRRSALLNTATQVYVVIYKDVRFIRWDEFKYHLIHALKYKKSSSTVNADEGAYLRQALTDTFEIEWATKSLRKFPE